MDRLHGPPSHSQFPTPIVMSPHVIRLRGPWRYEPLARYVRDASGKLSIDTAPPPAAGRLEMPADWSASLGGDFRGRVRYVRWFGCPTNLAPGDIVALSFAAAVGQLSLAINGHSLGQYGGASLPMSFDITGRLRERNELVVEVEHPLLADETSASDDDRPGGLVGEVRLQIDAHSPGIGNQSHD